MSFIVKGIQSALTPHGTAASDARTDNQAGAATYANNLLKSLYPTMQQEVNYANQQEPGREAAQTRALWLASPGNAQARQNLFNQQANSNAANAARIADQANKAAGISDSYTAGQNQAIANNAAQASNANWAQMNSPEYQTQLANSLLGQYQNAMQLPASSGFETMLGNVYGQPQVPVQPGLGQILGQVAGDAAAYYTGKPPKSGGSGGGGGGADGGMDEFGYTDDDPDVFWTGPPHEYTSEGFDLGPRTIPTTRR